MLRVPLYVPQMVPEPGRREGPPAGLVPGEEPSTVLSPKVRTEWGGRPDVWRWDPCPQHSWETERGRTPQPALGVQKPRRRGGGGGTDGREGGCRPGRCGVSPASSRRSQGDRGHTGSLEDPVSQVGAPLAGAEGAPGGGLTLKSWTPTQAKMNCRRVVTRTMLPMVRMATNTHCTTCCGGRALGEAEGTRDPQPPEPPLVAGREAGGGAGGHGGSPAAQPHPRPPRWAEATGSAQTLG